MQARSEVEGEGGRAKLVGVSVQLKPRGEEDDMLSATLRLKPFTPVTVMVELPSEPTLIDAGLIVPETSVKSTTMILTVIVCCNAPFVPVIVIV